MLSDHGMPCEPVVVLLSLLWSAGAFVFLLREIMGDDKLLSATATYAPLSALKMANRKRAMRDWCR